MNKAIKLVVMCLMNGVKRFLLYNPVKLSYSSIVRATSNIFLRDFLTSVTMAPRQVFNDSEKVCLQELVLKYKLNKSATLYGSFSAKKVAWSRLTEEFNSIETNTKRTEAQLKKCWDNLKTRQKDILRQEKRARMRTGGGAFDPDEQQPGCSSQMPPVSGETLIPEALTEQTDVEIIGAIDSDTVVAEVEVGAIPEIIPIPDIQIQQQCPSLQREVDTPTRNIGSRLTDYRTSTPQGPKNVRTRVIQEEFKLRCESYEKTEKREVELFLIKKREQEWLAKAAEEKYIKVKFEREAAEELLHYNRAKRQLAELELLTLKKTENKS